MARYKKNFFIGAGSLALSISFFVRLWMHAPYSHFISGFFLGMSIALLILGLASPSRGISR